jgi:nucleoside-diphosphate-sugar epimerase
MSFVRNVGALQIGKIDVDVVSLDDRASWPEAMRQCSVFIHCAGRAHITKGPGMDNLHEFRRANTELTVALAKSAADAGVKRFVFVSSIGVNGLTSGEKPFTPEDFVNPETPYAISKYEAEQGLQVIARETGLEFVVVRTPLVYGAGAPGNFGTLLAMLRRGWPLPLGAVTRNRRSYVALPNLVDLLVRVCDHPGAANQVFLVSDGEDISTTCLLRKMSVATGKPARLLPVPPALLRMGAVILGRPDLVQRLLADLRIDISKTRKVLGWSPPFSVDEGLQLAAEH